MIHMTSWAITCLLHQAKRSQHDTCIIINSVSSIGRELILWWTGTDSRYWTRTSLQWRLFRVAQKRVLNPCLIKKSYVRRRTSVWHTLNYRIVLSYTRRTLVHWNWHITWQCRSVRTTYVHSLGKKELASTLNKNQTSDSLEPIGIVFLKLI